MGLLSEGAVAACCWRRGWWVGLQLTAVGVQGKLGRDSGFSREAGSYARSPCFKKADTN